MQNDEKKEEKDNFVRTWRYHASKEPRIINSQEELDALGPGWEDTPAAFDTVPKPEKPKEEKVEPPKDLFEEVVESAELALLEEEELKKILIEECGEDGRRVRYLNKEEMIEKIEAHRSKEAE